VFRDAGIFGTGIEKIFDVGGKIKGERINTNEILIDEREGLHGDPRQMFQHKVVSKDVLKELYPDKADEIDDSKVIRDYNSESSDYVANPVSVVEAWHLPSGPEATNGKQVLAVSHGTLNRRDWTREEFPFSIFRWSKPPIGWFGTGIAEELKSLQIEINYLLQKIQVLMNLATTQVWVERGSQINMGNLTNDNMAARTYVGRPPIYMAVPPVAQQYFNHVDTLFNRGFEIIGVSQMAATSKKPAGLDSGVAIREYNDIGSMRFRHVAQRWEDFHMDSAKQMVTVAREIDQRGDGDIKVLAKGGKFIEEIKFRDVYLEDDQYIMQVYPTALLPKTPAGKLQTIKELGEINPEIKAHLMSLMDFPDTDALVNRINAPIDYINLLIERIIEHGGRDRRRARRAP